MEWIISWVKEKAQLIKKTCTWQTEMFGLILDCIRSDQIRCDVIILRFDFKNDMGCLKWVHHKFSNCWNTNFVAYINIKKEFTLIAQIRDALKLYSWSICMILVRILLVTESSITIYENYT